MGGKRVLIIALLLLCSFASDALAWWFSSDVSEEQERFENVIDGLKKAYKKKLQPLEETFLFEEFNSFMAIDDSDFEAKPMILLLGQYSTGKTSFIQYLLQSDFPGMEIGPEPTTDSFMAVMYGKQRQVTPGDVLVQDKTKPFKGLHQFGSTFLQHLKASNLPNPVLKSITLIDTPGGVLSEKRQHRDCGYDIMRVSSWLAERADMIILFLDVHKLDDNQEVINLIQKYQKKLLVVLNKADTITTPELIRVYGRVMWTLGNIDIETPEVVQVYIGSFWDKEYVHNEIRNMLDKHRNQLLTRIQELASLDAMNKFHRMIQRARQARTHALVLCHLRNGMPWLSSLSSTMQQNKVDQQP